MSTWRTGRVFAGDSHGWNRIDHLWVGGLSKVVDQAKKIVDVHREFRGGRLYIRGHRIECAKCDRTLAEVVTTSAISTNYIPAAEPA